MKYHFFSTLCNKADNFLDETLDHLNKGQITTTQAIQNLKMVESYDPEGEPYFEGVDMTKETKYEFIEYISNITSTPVDSVWDIYDQVYNETII